MGQADAAPQPPVGEEEVKSVCVCVWENRDEKRGKGRVGGREGGREKGGKVSR